MLIRVELIIVIKRDPYRVDSKVMKSVTDTY